MQRYFAAAAERLAPLVNMEPVAVAGLFGPCPNPEMGDFGMPCFPFAKALKKAPAAIAQELAATLGVQAPFVAVTATGPYLNFRIAPASFANDVLNAARDRAKPWGSGTSGAGKTVLVDYSSPNIAKPLAIHHIRSTIIGAALARLYALSGWNVERVNHLGDWGTNFGQLMVSYKKEEAAGKSVDIHELLRLYIRFHQDAADDESLQGEAKAWFVKLEQGDAEARRLWKIFCDESLKSFQALYKKLNVGFDHYIGESFYNDLIDATLQRIADKGLSEMSEGALVVKFPEADNMPPCLLRKQDGSTLYATRDLAAAEYRHGRFGFDKCLYVVANQQELHFRQVFGVLKRMGYAWADGMEHVKFGMLSFGEGVFEDGVRVTGSTRKGRIVFLEDVLEKAKARAKDLILENARDDEVRAGAEALAETIGTGAVIFNEFIQRRMKDVIFTWDRALNLQGDSGPYLQYTHARLSSVLRKYGAALPETIDFSPLATPVELDVVRCIARFPEVVERATRDCEPAMVAEYLLGLSAEFNRFFTDKANHRIIGDDAALTVARVGLTDAVRRVLAVGLGVLGLDAPERM